MVDERSFQLGRRCDEVEPGLGRLYEAWHPRAGWPALVLWPSERVEWRPEGRWQVAFTCGPESSAVSLVVQQAPARARASELATLLVLMSASVQRVEDSADVSTHLASRPRRPERTWSPRGLAAVAVLVLGLGLGPLLAKGAGRAEQTSEKETTSREQASMMFDMDEALTQALAYPLPAEPFTNQAGPPCKTESDAVEINKGCWVPLERRPPCGKEQAEHKGKCYLPVAKPKRPAQAIEP